MSPAKPKPSENARVRPALDRRKIAVAALALIDEKGIEHLSMRSIGAALDVEAMALYYYFSNKTDLLDGVRDHLLDELAQRVDPHAKPLVKIRALFEALRQIGLSHPDIITTLASNRFRSERALYFYEGVVATLRAAGLTPEQSARYFGILSQFTFGSCLFAAGARDFNPAAQPPTPDFAEKFPNIHAVAPYTSPEAREADFLFGLDLLMHSLKAERQD